MNNLWDKLVNIGFTEVEYPKKWIDELSEKYKLIRFFHKTQYTKSKEVLEKYDLMVHFDMWHVDFYSDEETLVFNKEYSVAEIFNHIEKVEIRKSRELKLKRINYGKEIHN